MAPKLPPFGEPDAYLLSFRRGWPWGPGPAFTVNHRECIPTQVVVSRRFACKGGA